MATKMAMTEAKECKDWVRELRKKTGMNRREFCEYFDIPYRTVTDWELGHRHAPDYVLRLLEYYIQVEGIRKIKKGEIKTAAELAAEAEQ